MIRAITTAILLAATTASAFVPCKRDASAPPMRVTLIESPAPMVECTARSLARGWLFGAILSTQAHACTLLDRDGAVIIIPTGPLIVLGLPFAFTPDRTIGHEMRHVTGWNHPPLLSMLPGECRTLDYDPPAPPDDPRTVLIHEYPITNTVARCNGKTACAELVEQQRCALFVASDGSADDGSYGRAVRACFLAQD